MAEEIIIELLARTKDAEAKLEEVSKQLSEITEQQKETARSTNKLVKGFKGVGLAMKAMGVKVILKLFDGLHTALMQNSEAVKIVTTVTSTLSILFGDIVNLLVPLGKEMEKAFTNPTQAIKDLGNLIWNYIVNYFKQAWEAVGHLGKALERLVNFDLGGAVQEFKNAGNDMVDALVGVEEGGVDLVKQGLEEVVEFAKELPDRINKASATAMQLLALQKKASEAEIERRRLQLEYQREEEILRQKRDDETRSIEDRIDANEKLLGLLSEQTEKEKESIQARVDAAKLQYQITGLHDDYLALKTAELEMTDLIERIEGQRSEGLINRMQLEKEALEIDRMRKQTKEEVELIEKRAIAEALDGPVEKLLMQQRIETQIHLDRLDRIEKERIAMASAGATNTLAYQQLLDEQDRLDAEYNATSLARTKQIEKLKADAKMQLAQDALATIGEIFGQESAAGKAAAIAQATINTYTGVTAALSNPAKLPVPLPQIQAGLVLAQGLANVRKIAQTQIPNQFGAGGSRGGGGAVASAPPNVSVIGGNVTGRSIATGVNEFGKKPTKAYVVSGDVSDGQALERRIERNASFG